MKNTHDLLALKDVICSASIEGGILTLDSDEKETFPLNAMVDLVLSVDDAEEHMGNDEFRFTGQASSDTLIALGLHEDSEDKQAKRRLEMRLEEAQETMRVTVGMLKERGFHAEFEHPGHISIPFVCTKREDPTGGFTITIGTVNNQFDAQKAWGDGRCDSLPLSLPLSANCYLLTDCIRTLLADLQARGEL